MKRIRIAFTAFGFLAACAPKVTETITDKDNSGSVAAMSATATKGKSLYSKKCSKCHDLKVIDNYSKESWSKILPNMASKAELTQEERDQVTAYINWELEN